MKILAYTYEADLHCIEYTRKRATQGGFSLADPLGFGLGNDENGIPFAATDGEGSAVHPVFSTDEMSFNVCGDCFQIIDDVRVIKDD